MTAFARDSVSHRLEAFVKEFDQRLGAYLTPIVGAPPELVAAIRYSALAPGKRIRPFLTVCCAELVGGRREDAWAPAAAVECIHAFSLIHDDLPAMDDDDVRRGRPTCHREFGEALAILAGDALAVFAFELIAREVSDPDRAVWMIRELGVATGQAGMIGGQAEDILAENQPPDPARVASIHDHKTAALFSAACRIGAIAGDADPEVEGSLARFGRHLGRAFQIADDLLDVTGGEAVGKRTGKDAAASKQTYPRCLGLEASRLAGKREAELALIELSPFGDRARDLADLADFVIARNY